MPFGRPGATDTAELPSNGHLGRMLTGDRIAKALQHDVKHRS